MSNIVSLVVPVYNVEKYLKKCLDSIFDQNISTELFQVIVVNDGTKDRSMEIVRQYQYPNLQIIEQENKGLSVARNEGLKVCKGKYVWFVDSDDWLLEGALLSVIETIRKYDGIDIISSSLKKIEPETGRESLDFFFSQDFLTGKQYLFRGYNQGAIQRFIIRRDFLIKYDIKFIPNILHEDGVFGYSILYLANNVFILPEPIYAYRIRQQDSIMSNIKIRSAYDLIKGHKILVKEDKQEFTEWIYNLIFVIFIFCHKILYTNDFDVFYKNNKEYIKSESLILLHSHKARLKFRGIFMSSMPLLYFKVKYLFSNNNITR